MTIEQLRAAMRKVGDDMDALLKLADEKQDGALDDEQQTQFDTFKAEHDKLKIRYDNTVTRQGVSDDLAAVPVQQKVTLDQPSILPEPVSVTGGNPRNDLKHTTHGFRHLGEQALAIHTAGQPGGNFDKRLEIGAAATGMQQGVGSDGGFLVPPSFSTTIWDGLNDAPDNLLGRTDQFTVEGESLTFPANAETSRADGSRYGGIRGYWISEASQITEQSPTFREVRIEPQELGVLVYVTNKLLKNSPVALDQYLTRGATDEILFKTGDAIINGTGAGQPMGVLNSNAAISIAKETGQAATTIVKENIDKMWARLHARSRANAVWFINQDIEPQLERLSIDVGTGGLPVYLPSGGIADTPNARLKGRPVVPIEYCPTLGTVGDIILADMMGYVTGTSGGIDAAMSIHLRFDYAETAFRFIFAVDGQTWLNSAITPFKGTNTQSQFLTLATRS
jgi:HK97 family phage major capsid protein